MSVSETCANGVSPAPSAAASPPCASGVAPPTRSLVTTSTRSPAAAAVSATEIPAAPDPTTTTSASRRHGLPVIRPPVIRRPPKPDRKPNPGRGTARQLIMASTAWRARAATAGSTCTSRTTGAQAPLQRLGRDHLHVVAGRVRVDRLQGHRRVGLAQLVQHPGLGRHEDRGRRVVRAAASIPPVERTFVRDRAGRPFPSATVPRSRTRTPGARRAPPPAAPPPSRAAPAARSPRARGTRRPRSAGSTARSPA